MSEPHDTVILTVELASGRFKTQLRVPMVKGEKPEQAALEAWADLVRTGFRIGATKMDVVLKEEVDR